MQFAIFTFNDSLLRLLNYASFAKLFDIEDTTHLGNCCKAALLSTTLASSLDEPRRVGSEIYIRSGISMPRRPSTTANCARTRRQMARREERRAVFASLMMWWAA